MKAAYPKYFLTPSGKPVSAKALENACKAIRQAPANEYPGWDWFPQTGYHILREVMSGIHHRINMRAE